MHRRRGRIFAVIPLIALSFWAGPSVSAHTATGSSGFYEYKWPAEPDLTLPWRFVSNFPGGNDRDRVREAAAAWDALGQPLQWGSNNTPDYSDFAASNPCAQPKRKNSVQWEDISTAGRAYGCFITEDGIKKIKNAQMVLDSAGLNWHKGTDAPSSNETDMLSLATHEWGHMSGSFKGTAANESDGVGHFGEEYETPCPGSGVLGEDNSTRETLCPTFGLGTYYPRTLSNHDSHTFQSAY